MSRPVELATLPGCEAEEWWERFEEAVAGTRTVPLPDDRTRVIAGPGGLPGVRIAELVSSGESVAIGTANSMRRWRNLGGSVGLGRFREGAAVGAVWPGSPDPLDEAWKLSESNGVLVFELSMLEEDPILVSAFANVATLDPPSSKTQADWLQLGEGLLHPLSGPSELEYAAKVAAHRFDDTARLRDLFRTLRDADSVRGELLRNLLIGPSEDPRSPEQAAVLVKILEEVGLIRGEGYGDARSVGVVSSEKVNLLESPTFRARIALQKEQLEFLRQSKRSMN